MKLDLDFRLSDPEFTLSALRQSITTLEEQLQEITRQRTRDAEARIAKHNPHDENELSEIHLIHQELEWEVGHTYPRVYRGAMLVLVWAAYEAGLSEVAEFVRKLRGTALSLSDIRGRTMLQRAKKYYPEVLKFDLFSSPKRSSQLREIELVRNAFAHANGCLARVSKNPRESLESMVRTGRLEEAFGDLRPTESFLAQTVALIDQELSSLVERARALDDEKKETARNGI